MDYFWSGNRHSAAIYGNRGVNGIDGTVSTDPRHRYKWHAYRIAYGGFDLLSRFEWPRCGKNAPLKCNHHCSQ